MMSALPETDIWTLTLRLPASYCGSYSLLEIPGTTTETIALSGGRFATLAGKADPLNKMPEINVRGNAKESVLTLDKAPALSEWNGGFHTGQLLTSMRIIAGKSRRFGSIFRTLIFLSPSGWSCCPMVKPGLITLAYARQLTPP